MKRFFSLIIISEDGKNKKHFNINLILFRTIIALSIIFILGVLFMAIYLGRIYADAAQKRIYEKRMNEMKIEIAKIDSLKQDIRYLYETGEKIKKLLGIEIQNTLLKTHKEDITNLKIDSIVSMESLKSMVSAYPDIWPVKGIISKEFSTDHPAIDIAAVRGSPVVSPIDGKIESIGWDKIFGNFVKIQNNEMTIFLGHLDKIFVENRQQIRKGEIVGLVGNTGQSTAPHLHYEIVMNSMLINPRRFLP